MTTPSPPPTFRIHFPHLADRIRCCQNATTLAGQAGADDRRDAGAPFAAVRRCLQPSRIDPQEVVAQEQERRALVGGDGQVWSRGAQLSVRSACAAALRLLSQELEDIATLGARCLRHMMGVSQAGEGGSVAGRFFSVCDTILPGWGCWAAAYAAASTAAVLQPRSAASQPQARLLLNQVREAAAQAVAMFTATLIVPPVEDALLEADHEGRRYVAAWDLAITQLERITALLAMARDTKSGDRVSSTGTPPETAPSRSAASLRLAAGLFSTMRYDLTCR